jgi:hypothetical protein
MRSAALVRARQEAPGTRATIQQRQRERERERERWRASQRYQEGARGSVGGARGRERFIRRAGTESFVAVAVRSSHFSPFFIHPTRERRLFSYRILSLPDVPRRPITTSQSLTRTHSLSVCLPPSACLYVFLLCSIRVCMERPFLWLPELSPRIF